MNIKNNNLSFKEKLAYGLGDTASNLFFQTFMIFLLYFYTDVFGISAAIAGTMFIITRFWDSANDPIMGIIADRTVTRWGKFRPYLIWLAIPFGFIGFLMFYSPGLGMMGKIIYAYITYSFMMMIYTAINIPYSALMGVMSSNSLVRTSLSSFRFVCAFLGGLIIQSATMPLINTFGKDKENIINAEVVNNNIRITENSDGVAKIIVYAKDTDGNQVKTDFHVNVKSEEYDAPQILKSPDDIRLDEGFNEYVIDYSGVFDEQKGKKYKYKISSNNENVVKAKIDKSNKQIKLVEKGNGISNIKLSAIDKRWGDVSAEFKVIVTGVDNSLPVVKQHIQDFKFTKGFGTESIELSQHIVDTLGDQLTYSAISSKSSVIATSVKGKTLYLTEQIPSNYALTRKFRTWFFKNQPEKGTGYTEITVSASDNKGGYAETKFEVIVSDPNANPPFIKSKPKTVNLKRQFKYEEFEMAEYFAESDNGKLNYSIELINEKKGFARTMLMYAAIASILFLITFFFTKERVQPPVKQKTSLKNDLRDLISNKPWIILFFVGIFTLSWVSIHLGTLVYYFKYYVGDESKVTLFLIAGSVFNILGVVSTKYLTKFFGKKKLYFLCMLSQSLLLGLFYFAGPGDIGLMYALHIPAAFLSGPTQPLVWAMYADTADYSEWKTGRRATGLVFSAATFAQKMGWTIGGALTGWILAYYGFIANEIQSPETQEGIRIMKTIYPMIGGILASITVLFYKLDEKVVSKIQEELEKRRT
jgi:Na+/melibiose symporter-like transporter